MYYYGSRFYSADIGRFLQSDSIVPGAGNLQALNRYSYVDNSPLGYIDPTGHDPIGACNCGAITGPMGRTITGIIAFAQMGEAQLVGV
ncbi:MAG: hypothetical protein E6J43_09140 [Chloroflexi bacterium]|nr:MAG: hypothetical protein E6J43_09140 [Chloroflexota bacterium]